MVVVTPVLCRTSATGITTAPVIRTAAGTSNH
jgi:hypothetical protein